MNEAKQVESIIALAQKIKQLKKETLEEIQKIKETVALISQKLSEIKIDEKLLEVNKKLNEKIEESQSKFENKILEVQENLTALSNLKNDLERLQNEILSLEDKVNTDSQDLEEAQEKIANLEEIIAEIEKELRRIKAVVSRINQKVLTAVWGFTLLINGIEKGSYSRINLIEGNNITFDFSENKQEGRVNLTINSTGGGSGGGATTFLGLTDTPSSYDTHALKLVQVNSSENALQFAPISSLLTAGDGISLSGTTNVTITNTGILSLNAGDGISISGDQNPTISNTGILSLNAGPGISITEGQNPTISNTGVLSLNNVTGNLTLQGTTNQVNVNTLGNTITLSLPQNIHSGATPIFAGLTLSSLTPGSVLFAGTGGAISQNNSRFFWDNTNLRLGIGTSTPAGILHVVAGTVNALVVSDSGNVGIRTTNPGAQLDVAGNMLISGDIAQQRLGVGISGTADIGIQLLNYGRKHAGIRFTGNQLVVEDASGGGGPSSWYSGSTLDFIVRNGNVGIGTMTPSRKLHIVDNVSVNVESLLIQNNGARASLRLYGKSSLDAGSSSANVQFYDQDTTNNAHLVFESRATNAPLAIWINGSRRLGIYGGSTSGISVGSYSGVVPPNDSMIIPGNVGIGVTNPVHKLVIRAGTADPTISLLGRSTDAASAIRFYDNSGTTPHWNIVGFQNMLVIHEDTNNRLFNILKNGNVGIGTTNPQNRLHVSGGEGRIISEGTAPGVWMFHTSTSNRSFVGSHSTANNIGFWTSGAGWGLVMLQNGNVGIGTTAPTAKLHIEGTTGYNQLRLATSYTPTSSADSNGNVGDVAWDNNYIYVKTSTGWKRTALVTF
jgi:hypothetical protein